MSDPGERRALRAAGNVQGVADDLRLSHPELADVLDAAVHIWLRRIGAVPVEEVRVLLGQGESVILGWLERGLLERATDGPGGEVRVRAGSVVEAYTLIDGGEQGPESDMRRVTVALAKAADDRRLQQIRRVYGGEEAAC